MNEYIADKGTVSEEDIPALLGRFAREGSKLFCVYTTRFGCDRYDGSIDDIAHALEIRLFDEEYELKAVRAQIGRPFKWRLIDDEIFRQKLADETDVYSGSFEKLTYPEKQYLDIDTKKTEPDSRLYTAIGGGTYTLPESGLECAEIRHYGSYDEDGLFVLGDMRIVRFYRREKA